MPFYIMRIAYIVIGCIYMAIHSLFISKINRYETIISRQIKLREFIGTKPIHRGKSEQEITEFYKRRLEVVANWFLLSKIILLVVFVIACIVMFWLQYGGKVMSHDLPVMVSKQFTDILCGQQQNHVQASLSSTDQEEIMFVSLIGSGPSFWAQQYLTY